MPGSRVHSWARTLGGGGSYGIGRQLAPRKAPARGASRSVIGKRKSSAFLRAGWRGPIATDRAGRPSNNRHQHSLELQQTSGRLKLDLRAPAVIICASGGAFARRRCWTRYDPQKPASPVEQRTAAASTKA